MKILCIGGSAWDITLPVADYQKENKKYKINQVYECGGGCANNAAYLLASWGCDVHLLSIVGKDLNGTKIKKELHEIGVNIDYVYENDLPTATSYILNNQMNGSRTIITNKSLLTSSLICDINFRPDVIFCDGNYFDITKKILQDNPQSLKIIDAGSYQNETKTLAQYCDYIVCSNDFAKDYTNINFSYDNEEELSKVYDLIQKDYEGQLIITLEHAGSFTKIDHQSHLIPSISVHSLDSTGAGDIYHAAFTYFIMEHYDLLEAMRYANIAGALSVTKISSKKSMPKFEEVIKK